MSEAAESGRRIATLVAGLVLLLGGVVAIVVWDPVGGLVRGIDLPEWVSLSELPDLPRWLLWALGKVKFVVIALVTLVIVVRELRRSRGA